jgi:hypothetical protein
VQKGMSALPPKADIGRRIVLLAIANVHSGIRFGKNSPVLGRKRQDKPDLYRIASLAQICKFQIVLLIGKIS